MTGFEGVDFDPRAKSTPFSVHVDFMCRRVLVGKYATLLEAADVFSEKYHAVTRLLLGDVAGLRCEMSPDSLNVDTYLSRQKMGKAHYVTKTPQAYCRARRDDDLKYVRADVKGQRRPPVVSRQRNMCGAMMARPEGAVCPATSNHVQGQRIPVKVYVDTCAPRGICSKKEAIVEVTERSPNIKLRGVGGVVDVEAIVTIGYYMKTRDGDLYYVQIKECLYCPDAQAELYPTRAAFQQLNCSHHFDDLCFIHFADGTRVHFEDTANGYLVDAFYGPPPSADTQMIAFAAAPCSPTKALVDDGPVVAPSSPFVIFLCSGPRRDGDFAYWVEKTSRLKVLNVDILLNGRHHDLTKDDVKLRLIEAASHNDCKGVMISTPCSTWSAARYNEGGPPVLRNLDNPMGIPSKDGKLPMIVTKANTVLETAIDVAWAVVSKGGSFIFEQPVSRARGSPQGIPGREMHAAISSYPKLVQLLRAYRSLSVCFEQCKVGADSQKCTELLASPQIFDFVVQHFGSLRCNHIECRKYSLIGKSSPGTGSGSENYTVNYTSKMCELLAKCFVAACTYSDGDDAGDTCGAPTTPTSVMQKETDVFCNPPNAPSRESKSAPRLRSKVVPGMSATSDTVWRRLAYPAAEAWSHVPNVMHNTGLPKGAMQHARDPSTIPAVQAGRMKARAFPGIPDTAPNRTLQIVYMDFCGPFKTPSIIDGFIHYCGVVDAFSGYSRVFACHNQTAKEAVAALQQFINDVRAKAASPIENVAVVRTDAGSAFVSEDFKVYVATKVGAVLSLACFYTPEQNSYAERLWMSVVSTARVYLASAGLPPEFHSYAVQLACYLRNRMPSSTRSMRSPYMVLTGQQADMSRLRVFGCLCHVFHPPGQRKNLANYEQNGKKLIERATSGVYLGPSEKSPGSLVYVRKSPYKSRLPAVMLSAHTQCCESILPGDTDIDGGSAPVSVEMSQLDVECEMVTDAAGERCDLHADATADAVSNVQVSAVCEPPTVATTTSSELLQSWPPKVGQRVMLPRKLWPNDSCDEFEGKGWLAKVQAISKRGAKVVFDSARAEGGATYGSLWLKVAELQPLPGSRTADVVKDAVAHFTDPTVCTSLAALQNNKLLGDVTYAPAAYWSAVGYSAVIQPTLELGDVTIPTSYKNALSSPHKDYWRDAISKELNGLMTLNTWDVVTQESIPSGRNLMNCHFIFDLKRNSDGSVAKFKARLVADGNTQKEGIDYSRIFSTVVKMSTLRLLLIIATKRGYFLSQVDIRMAFLQADIDGDLWMRMPPGLPRYDNTGKVLVAKLNKSLYGLKQAGREFNIILVEFLESIGFQRSVIDSCLFVKTLDATVIMLAVWVDDIVIAASTFEVRTAFVKLLRERFPIEETDSLEWILGMKVAHRREEKWLSVSQKLYVEDLLQKYAPFLTDSCKSFDVPMADTPVLSIEMCPEEGSVEHEKMKGKQQFYMTIVGSLLWLAATTRPDIAHATSVVARFVSNPGMPHYNAIIRMLVYLRTTKNFGLVFDLPKPDSGVEVYADANWCTKFSTSGALYYYDGSLFAWYSRLQRSVCHSTAEAEYISASAAAREGIFHREVALDCGALPKGPSMLLLDSKSAIDMCYDPCQFKKTKHILRDAHFLRDVVAREVFKPAHVSSEEEVADIMSKAVSRPIFLHLRPHLVRMID